MPLPPFSPSCSGAPVSETVHMNSASSGTAVSVSILCAPLRGMYTHLLALVCFLLPLPFFFLSLQRMGKLQSLSNSKYISGTIGMPGHPPLPSYLHIFIWKCPSGAVLFLEKPHKLQGLVICCRGPCVMGCVVGSVVLHTSCLWPFPHCLV